MFTYLYPTIYLYLRIFICLQTGNLLNMKHLSSVLLAMCIGAAANAQTMQPGFKDFDVATGIASSSPKYLLSFGNKLYFYGSDGNIGREPYMVSGAGTPVLIQNMNTLSAHSIGLNYIKPNAGMNGKYYFTGNDGGTGEELYMYDGTNAPTLVQDLTVDGDSSMPDNYVVLNNKLYFTADVDNFGPEMYVYDGTNAPARITDINAGPDGSVYGPMVAYNNKIFFVGKTAAHGEELWQLDPATNTPTMVADIDTGVRSSAPANLAVLNGKLYFSATSFFYGRELYVFDGSTTTRLTDISFDALSSLSVSSSPNSFAWFNNKVYFSARDTSGQYHVWAHGPADASLAFKLNPNGDSGPKEFVVYNNRLIFTATDGANGYELFAYDGTNPPAIIGDLCPGPNSSLPQELTQIGDELYFSANNCNNSGVDLFSYNYKRVGVRNTLFDAEVEIFPNPVEKDLNIHMTLKRDEELRIRVANIAGKNIYDGTLLAYTKGKNKTSIPMRNLPSGNYIYYISNKEGTTYLTGKVVKQ